jgi:hypothetical protein
MYDPWVLALDLRTIIDDLVIKSVPGAVDLHAGMAEVGDEIVLFPGDPGAGKTTLLLAGLERGWRLLCDDLSLFDLNTSRVTPMPRPIGIRSGTPLARFASRWEPPGWLPDPTTPYLLPASAFPLGTLAAPVSPTAIFFPSFDRGRATELRRLSAAETVARIGRHVAPLIPKAVTALSVLGRTASGAGLVYGDPQEGARVVETGLSSGER